MKRTLEIVESITDCDANVLYMSDACSVILSKLPSYAVVLRSVCKLWKHVVDDIIPKDSQEHKFVTKWNPESTDKPEESEKSKKESKNKHFEKFAPIGDIIFESYATYMRKMYKAKYPILEPISENGKARTREDKMRLKKEARQSLDLIVWLMKTQVTKTFGKTIKVFSQYMDVLVGIYTDKSGIAIKNREPVNENGLKFLRNKNVLKEPAFWLIATDCTNTTYDGRELTFLNSLHNQLRHRPSSECINLDDHLREISHEGGLISVTYPGFLIYTAIASFADIGSFCRYSNWKDIYNIMVNNDMRHVFYGLASSGQFKKFDKFLTHFNSENEFTNCISLNKNIVSMSRPDVKMLKVFFDHCNIPLLRQDRALNKENILCQCIRKTDIKFFNTMWTNLFDENEDKHYLLDALRGFFTSFISPYSFMFTKLKIFEETPQVKASRAMAIYVHSLVIENLANEDIGQITQMLLVQLEENITSKIDKLILSDLFVYFLIIIFDHSTAFSSEYFVRKLFFKPESMLLPLVLILVQERFPDLLGKIYNFNNNKPDYKPAYSLFKSIYTSGFTYPKDHKNLKYALWSKANLLQFIANGYKVVEKDLIFFMEQQSWSKALIVLKNLNNQIIISHHDMVYWLEKPTKNKNKGKDKKRLKKYIKRNRYIFV